MTSAADQNAVSGAGSARLRTLGRIDAIEAAQWDALADDDNPFASHAFLTALESSGSLRRELGWSPRHLVLECDGGPIAAAPAYLKTNSHGEFVFDHAWAEAHERLGLAYFPKLLIAAPYSPVDGPRLLAGSDAAAAAGRRTTLLDATIELARRERWSSVHVNFVGRESEREALRAAGWIERRDVQFKWRNRGYATFDDFLARLNAKRRKEIRRERARVAADGWRFEWQDGTTLDAPALASVHAFYQLTFARKGNYPALTDACFSMLASGLQRRFLVCCAIRDARVGAAAVFLRSASSLFGRYWGAREESSGLHFEACYYQGIDYAIRNGIALFEPGAQGEHKLARGFLPETTHSFHWIAHPRLRELIAHSVERERISVAQYLDALAAHSPYAEGRE
jgi:predicted N-acyltransferase